MKPRAESMGAVELAEEAVNLIRSVPLKIPASYYVGSLPFFLSLLYFWVDMSRGAFGHGRCVGSALGVAVMFIWMKAWQSVYARGLLAHVQGEEPPRWSMGRVIRLVAGQTAIQAWGFVTLPLALVALLPLPWAYAYYQNVSVLGDGERDLSEVRRRAWAQAKVWPRQNVKAMWLFSPLLVMIGAVFVLVLLPVVGAIGDDAVGVSVNVYASLFGLLLIPLSPLGLVAAWNLGLLVAAVPWLIEVFLGVETMLSRGGGGLTNATGLAIVCALVYLVMDPCMKAVYVLRCYYGASVETGADLAAQLRSAIARSSTLLGVALVVACVLLGGGAFGETGDGVAGDGVAGDGVTRVSATELDDAIERVMQQREYSWRLPRVEPKEEVERGIIGRFLADMLDVIAEWAEKIAEWFRAVLKWIGDRMPSVRLPQQSSGGDWMTPVHGLAYVLMAVALCALAILLIRVWRQRTSREPLVEAESIVTVEDLEEESLTADALPEDRWQEMAHDLIQQGELRLALRALFLGTLAYLSHSELVSIRRFKSNRDYARELERRSHAYPTAPQAFAKNVLLFECIWYGRHEVSQESVEEFRENHRQIRQAVEGATAAAPPGLAMGADMGGPGAGSSHA